MTKYNIYGIGAALVDTEIEVSKNEKYHSHMRNYMGWILNKMESKYD